MAVFFDSPFQTVSTLVTGFASEKVPSTAAFFGFYFHLRPRTFNDHSRTFVAMSERTGLSVSQVTDEVLYTGLVEMQELPEHDE